MERKEASEREAEIVAELDGEIVGTSGISSLGTYDKLKHRAVFGISVAKEYWGLGIGRALTESCIECARKAGYLQCTHCIIRPRSRHLRSCSLR